MLDEVLRDLAEGSPGFRGAAVVGMDGVPLVKHDGPEGPEGPDLELCAAEYTSLLKAAGALSSHQGAGPFLGLATRMEAWSVLAEQITDDYFVVLLVNPGPEQGRGRYELRKAALRLLPELS